MVFCKSYGHCWKSPSDESLAEHQESNNALKKFEHNTWTSTSQALGTPNLQYGVATN
jgi:hypothetical protein